MRHKAKAGWICGAVSLLLIGLGSVAEAELGCFTDGGGSVASCTEAADCGPVGGVDCTSEVCFCPGSPTDPFCPCAAASVVVPAPVLSAGGIVSAVVLILATGLVGLWRRPARTRHEQA